MLKVKAIVRLLLAVIILHVGNEVQAQKSKSRQPEIYYPGQGNDWKHLKPEEAGFDPVKLKAAIEYGISVETKNPRDMEVNHYRTFGKEPFGDGIGPFKPRGDATGIILKGGYIIAEWGDPWRVDMTHSVTKSFLSTVVGLAVDKGMIASVNDTVWRYVPPILPYTPMATGNKADQMGQSDWIMPFETPHNRTITWDHLLRQTSDWEGTLWGKPEWADRPDPKPELWMNRPRQKPGAVFEYNDVRVNVMALAALTVWRRPLPQVLKENIMDPIGASNAWRWYGYENSFVIIDGQIMQSVSGGGHWGGGMIISARDMARFGLLTQRNGRWKDRQLISENWVKMAKTPTPAEPTYGFMNWFLNTDKKLYPSAPASSFVHIGNGSNIIYVDPEHDLVIVARWISTDGIDGFIGKVLESLKN